MLATASPVPRSSSLPAPHTSQAAAHRSPGDSDYDCSDDEPALSVLRDELRTTTEKFFERESGHHGGPSGRGGRDGGSERRRAYSVLTPKLPPGGAPKQQKSWNALNDLEKGVGGMIRRSASPAYRVVDRNCSDSIVGADGGVGGGDGEGGDGGGSSIALGTAFPSNEFPPPPRLGEGGESYFGEGGSRGRDGGGGGFVAADFGGEGVNDFGCVQKVPSRGTGTGDNVGVPTDSDSHLSLAYAKTKRWLHMPSTEDTLCNTPSTSPMRADEFGSVTTPRMPLQQLGYTGDMGASVDPEATQEDLKARSEEATRTLKALKMLLVEEGRKAEEDDYANGSRDSNRGGECDSDRDHDGSGGSQSVRQANKLWPTIGAKRPAPGMLLRQPSEHGAVFASSSSTVSAPTTPAMAASGGSNTGDVSSHVPQLLQAMDDLQSINAELIKALGGSGMDESDRVHRRLGSSSSSRLQEEQQRQRPGPGPRQRSGRMLPSGMLARQSRSSSELLQRRHTRRGQAEPMSCGVPRHRVQVSKHGDDVVFFELAITQARSTWTLERRMDEFLELRRSLVGTATELAVVAAGAAAKYIPTNPLERERGGPVCPTPRSTERKRKSSGALDAVDENGGVRGGATTAGWKDRLREAEARVPKLPGEQSSWFGTMRLWPFVSARKREERLTEKQVLLASWLANVLADHELMSPDLVRFLGGDYGGMQAQPVVADVVADCDSRGGGRGSFAAYGGGRADLFEVSDDDCATVDESDDGDDSEDDSVDDLASELESLRESLCAPDEWALDVSAGLPGSVDSGGRNARSRLEKAMGKRVAIARAGSVSPMFPVGGEVLPLEAMRDSRRVGGVAGSDKFVGATGAEVAVGERDGDGEGEVTVRSYSETFSPSLVGSRCFADAAKERRQSGPSPSSPSRRVTLDVFFRVPT